MAGFRRVRGVRSRLPTGVIIGRKTGGTGKAEMLTLSEFGAALAQGAPGSIPPAGSGAGVPIGGSDGQVLAKVAGVPAWSFLSLLTKVGTLTIGVWNATKIGLLFGGTNADLSGTGGAGKVLKQTSAGAAITVAQVDYSELSGTQPVNAITALTGDVTASGTGSQAATLATVNSNVGTFGDATHSVTLTVNAKGLVTAASQSVISSGGSGTVTSVSMTVPAELSVSGSPITGSGTLAVTWASEADDTILSRIAGSAGVPSFNSFAAIFDHHFGTADGTYSVKRLTGAWTVVAAGTGTVTSVAATVPTGLAVSGSPITTTGTLGFTWSGLIPLAQGGTHVDLTATGPGYLKQASAGASVTVGATIPYTDITGGPAVSNYDVGGRTLTPSVPGSRMFLSQQLGAVLPAAGGICGGPLCSGPMTCDTLEYLHPVWVDGLNSGAGPCLQWEGPGQFYGNAGNAPGGRWRPSLSIMALTDFTGLVGAVYNLTAYNANCAYSANRLNGTPALPTKLLNGQAIGRYVFFGSYDTTGVTVAGARINVDTIEDWSSTANGTKISLKTAAVGGTSPADCIIAQRAGSTINGTNTNDNAAAGNYGEFASSVVPFSGRVATNGAAANVTTLSLTAGDWVVSGGVEFYWVGATGAVTFMEGHIGTTSLSLGDNDANNSYNCNELIGTTTQFFGAISLAPCRISLSATTTVYLSAKLSGVSAGGTAYGTIRAWRVR